MSPVKSPQELSAREVGKNNKIVVEKDEEEELLPGWTKEVKVRRSGSSTKVDRYYTDPVTGYVFRSLRDVQRYLKTGELGRLAKKPKMKEREEPNEVKEPMSVTMGNERTPTDNSELPARASKRLAGTNNDAPSSPQSGPKTRLATRLDGVNVRSASSLHSFPAPKTRQATRLAEVAVDAPPPSSLLPEPKTRQAKRLAGVTVDRSLPSPSLPDTRTNHQATRLSGTSPAAPKTRQAARHAGIKINSPPASPPDSKTLQAKPLTGTEFSPSPPSQPEPRTRQAKRVSGIRDNASPASPPQPKTRRATQLAGIKIESPPSSPPDTRTSRQATKTRLVTLSTPKENVEKTEAKKSTDKYTEEKSITISLLNQENNEKQELRNLLPPVTPKEHNKQIETRPTISPAPEDQAPPTVVPPLNLEKQDFPVLNPTTSNSSDMKADSSINFSVNDLWADPCIEFAVKTLTGAVPFPDLNKVENFTTAPSQVPLEELWTDPCIEFAVKTLTGAIPIQEDNYLPHRPASSTNPQGPHQFSSPDVGLNLRQTDVLSKPYDTGHKNKQQDSVFQRLGNSGFQKQQDSVFPTLGYGGFQKSGAFVNGSNGQCSRSRFFQ